MKNLPERDKYFWKNLFQYFLIVTVAIIVAASGWGSEESRRFNLEGGITLVGIAAIVILGFKIAMDMTNQVFKNEK